MKRLLIGIAGHAGVGKDTAAGMLRNIMYQEAQRPVSILHFADPLKRACAEAFGIPVSHFHLVEHKEVPNEFWGVSPRKIAQFVGTEMFRDTTSRLLTGQFPSFWISRMSKELQNLPSDTVVIIPDVRFQDEYDWLQSQDAFVVHLTRDGKDGNIGISNHASEKGIVKSPIALRDIDIENNGSLFELYDALQRAFFPAV